MNSTIKSLLKAAVFAVVGLVVLWLVYRSNNAAYLEECALKGIPEGECSLVDKVITDIKAANYLWVLLALVVFTISNVSRAVRWHIMLEPLGYKPSYVNSLGAILIAYLSNLGLPRSGEFVRAGVLAKNEGYSADKVMGTIVLDRVADVIMLLVVIGLTILLSYDDFYGYLSSNLQVGDKLYGMFNISIIAPLILITSVLLWVFYKYKEVLLTSKLGSKVVGLLQGFKEGVLSITKLRRPWAFVLHSVIIWICYFVMTYVVFFAFEPTSHLGPVAGLVVFVFGTLGIVFPSPGGMGSYHYLVGEGLALYGIEAGDAFSFANIIFFSVQLLCNVLLGLIALIVLPIYNSRKTV